MNRAIAAVQAATAVLGMSALMLAGCTGSSHGHTSSSVGPSGGAASTSGTGATSAAPLTVDTTSGRLYGLATARAREFLGVRYAQPPTGARRWTLPRPVVKAAGTVPADKPGASCAQAGGAPGASATASTTEDCLFLNVTTPKNMAAGAHLPVMVWSHGGGYTSGDGAAYDAQRLASQGNVIVVTVNKRLGVFGYLGLPGLSGGGDFGLADVVAALKWTRANAAAFGGDAGNVTLFGESDGAMSSCALLTSPQATGLFDKLALSSGGTCLLNWPRNGLVVGAPAQTPYTSAKISDALGLEVAKKLGCSGSAVLACLRKLPTKKLLPISADFSDVLAYDTPLLPSNPATALLADKVADVPILSGSNQNEERAFVGGLEKAKPGTVTSVTYPVLIRQAFGTQAGTVLAHYPAARYASPALAFAAVITDRSWACPTLAGNAALAEHGSTVYGYEFAAADAPDVNRAATKDVPQGAAHATDLPYLFDLGGKSALTTTAQRTLATRMVGYWSSFARTGRPTASGGPAWPRLTSASGPTLQLADTSKTVDFASEHQCSFWARLH